MYCTYLTKNTDTSSTPPFFFKIKNPKYASLTSSSRPPSWLDAWLCSFEVTIKNAGEVVICRAKQSETG